MRRILLVLLLALGLLMPAIPAASVTGGYYFVGFHGAIPPDAKPLVESVGARVVLELAPISSLLVYARDGTTLKTGLSSDPRIRYVVEEARNAVRHAEFTDPDWTAGRQRHLDHQKVPLAWQADLVGTGVLLAVIDSGVNLTHAEIVPNLWDDGSGVKGYNFVNPNSAGDRTYMDTNPEDVDGHGTMVAGIAMAAANGVGMVGVAPGAKLLPLRTGSEESQLVRAILKAVEKKADVIVVAQGFPPGSGAPETQYPALRDAVLVAIASGATVVASTGHSILGEENPNARPVYYPAAYPEVVAVTVATVSDEGVPAGVDYFRWGSAIDVAAAHPAWTTCVDNPLFPEGRRCGTCTENGAADRPTRHLTCGPETATSFAAPQVGGVVAIMLQCRPALLAVDVQTILNGTATDVETGGGASDGFDKATGNGLVNVEGVLEWIRPCSDLPWTGPPSGSSGSGDGRLTQMDIY